jgi:hypothetical protein
LACRSLCLASCKSSQCLTIRSSGLRGRTQCLPTVRGPPLNRSVRVGNLMPYHNMAYCPYSA